MENTLRLTLLQDGTRMAVRQLTESKERQASAALACWGGGNATLDSIKSRNKDTNVLMAVAEGSTAKGVLTSTWICTSNQADELNHTLRSKRLLPRYPSEY